MPVKGCRARGGRMKPRRFVMHDCKGNSFSNGPAACNGPSACNGIVNLLHEWFCACRWCVQGHK